MKYIKPLISCKTAALLLWCAVFAFTAPLPVRPAPASKSLPLDYISGQTSFYTGQDYTLQWAKNPALDLNYKSFMFSLYQGGKPVIRIQLKRQFPLTATFNYPKLRQGVTVKTTAIISASRNNKTWKILFHHPFHFASPGLTVSPPSHFKKNSIGVLDLSPGQILVSFLRDRQFPFIRVTEPETFEGKWLLCAGLDFIDSPRLVQRLTAAAKNGTSVLIIPPLNGTFPFPAYIPGMRWTFGDENTLILEDHRLNPVTAGLPRQISFVPQTGNNTPGIAVQKETPGFSWAAFKFPRARIFLCGWDLARSASKNPAPVFLLSRLFNAPPNPAKRDLLNPKFIDIIRTIF